MSSFLIYVVGEFISPCCECSARMVYDISIVGVCLI